jgi:hypothetical protein
MIKIRFYHWWIYKLYHKTWTPIFNANPQMVHAQVKWQTDWLKNNAKPR